jgi:hypothetical protein
MISYAPPACIARRPARRPRCLATRLLCGCCVASNLEVCDATSEGDKMRRARGSAPADSDRSLFLHPDRIPETRCMIPPMVAINARKWSQRERRGGQVVALKIPCRSQPGYLQDRRTILPTPPHFSLPSCITSIKYGIRRSFLSILRPCRHPRSLLSRSSHYHRSA